MMHSLTTYRSCRKHPHHVRWLRKWPYEQLLPDIRTQLGE